MSKDRLRNNTKMGYLVVGIITMMNLKAWVLGIKTPEWDFAPPNQFEASWTLMTCTLLEDTTCKPGPFPKYIYIQKVVNDKWEDACIANNDDTYEAIPLPGGHTVDGRVKVQYRVDFNTEYKVTLTNLMLEDNGEWRCVLKDCGNEEYASNNASLTVITNITDDAVKIQTPPHIILGYPAEFICTSERVNPEFDVVWDVNGNTFTNGTPENEFKDFFYAIKNTNDFTFCDDHKVSLVCTLEKTTEPKLKANQTADEVLIYAPAFIESVIVSNSTPAITETLTMACTASGTSRTVSWSREDGADLDDLFEISIDEVKDNLRCSVENGTKLTMTWTQDSDTTCQSVIKHNGVYKCDVTAALGTSDESSEHHITAQYGPIVSGETNIAIHTSVGSNETMLCETDCAEPADLLYSWTSDNDRGDLEHYKKTISILVTEEDFNATFKCLVKNSVGEIERTFIIYKKDVPPSTTTPFEPTTTFTETTPDGNVTTPRPDQTALIIANAVIWSLCGVVAIVLVCLALYHYRQIQNGKKYQDEYSEEIVLTHDEEKPCTSHNSGSDDYDDISHSVVAAGSVGAAVGKIPDVGLYAEVQTPGQTQLPVAPKRSSKMQTSQPQPSTPKVKRTHAINATQSPMNARHQHDSPPSARRPEPKADYSPLSNRKEMPQKHSNESNHGGVSKSPNKLAAVKQNTNGAKPSVPVKPDIQSFRSSRSSGINQAGARCDNAEVNLYANCDQRPIPKNDDGTITYADLALQQEDPYEEGAPPVPKKNMNDQEPVQYASIKRNK